MAKKRKASRKSEPTGPREVDAKDARLTVKTFADVANSEDEYYAEKDRIDFESDNDERRTKRRKRQEKEDEFLEASDEEIFAEDDSDESDEEKAEAPTKKKAAKSKGKKAGVLSDDDEDEAPGPDDEGDEGWWGTSKKEYYNADAIETEADALEEEAEARRLQAKKLAKMQEADFAFDEAEWANPKQQSGEDEEIVTEVLNDLEVTEDMGPEERHRLLQVRYPEFDYLVDEFRDLRPLLETLKNDAEGKPAKSLEVVKSWILGCYVAALASYFAILTSPARDGANSAKPLSPAELREHEVMETLMSCRDSWLRAKALKPAKAISSSTGMLSPPDEDMAMDEADASVSKPKKEKKPKEELKAIKARKAEKAKKAKAVEKSLADLSTMLKSNKRSAKAESKAVDAADDSAEDDNSDFGEEENLDARTAEDKARRKKTLKFYTSQIVQKASKRAGAGRDAGGDNDIPYRERLRDRAARLNLEAERRGKKTGKGAELGGDDSDNEAALANEVRDGEDEYYDMVAQAGQQKRADKEARFEAIAAARKGERVVETEETGKDGKRQITYQIQKNKGMMPHRKKEVRNPRVKKRMKYEEKQKKLKTMKSVFQGGEGRGGYQGETTGIKTNVVKSIKL